MVDAAFLATGLKKAIVLLDKVGVGTDLSNLEAPVSKIFKSEPSFDAIGHAYHTFQMCASLFSDYQHMTENQDILLLLNRAKRSMFAWMKDANGPTYQFSHGNIEILEKFQKEFGSNY